MNTDLEHLRPYIDGHTRATIARAARQLGFLRGYRGPYLDDPTVRLCLLASLQHQLRTEIVDTARQTHEDGYTPDEFLTLLTVQPPPALMASSPHTVTPPWPPSDTEPDTTSVRHRGRQHLEPGTTDTGYGHTAAQVVAVRPRDTEVLLRYLDAVTARTRSFLEIVSDAELDRVIDRSWDPPVTMGVRLVSVLDDGTQPAGQAAYLRGLYDRIVRAG